MRHGRRPLAVALVAALGLAAAAALDETLAAGGHVADADDVAMVVRGQQVYRQYCASCHGSSLQGQPLWQLRDAFAGRRAPAHDESGHTWQHGDEALFRMTKFGRFDRAGPATSMPAFQDALSDRDILSVLAFIKARWPVGLRVVQAMLNPGQAGLPAPSDRTEWRFPPICMKSPGL